MKRCAWCTRELPETRLTFAPDAHQAWSWWCADERADECIAHRRALSLAGTLDAALAAHHAVGGGS